MNHKIAKQQRVLGEGIRTVPIKAMASKHFRISLSSRAKAKQLKKSLLS